MIIKTSVTRFELSEDEREILREAIDVLHCVNGAININANTDYMVTNDDMSLYNMLYNEIDRIENYVIEE